MWTRWTSSAPRSVSSSTTASTPAALNRAKDAILTQLASAAEGELPSVLVETAYQQEMERFQQQLQMQRLSLDRYLSQVHQTRESFTAAVRAVAEKNTRARMALLQVAQSEGLLPTEEEIDKTLSERAERTKKTLEEDQGCYQRGGHAPQRGHPPRCRLRHRALHH